MFRPRIAVVTPLFPIRSEIYRGQPIYLTVRELCAWSEVGVFSPAAVYPRLRALQPRNYVFKRADPAWKPEGIPQLQYLEYPALPVAGRLTNGWLSYRAMLPALRAFGPDVILAYWLYPEGWGAVRAGRQLGIPVVAGSRGSDLLKIADPWTLRMTKKAVAGAVAIVTVSEELKRRAIELGASAEMVHVILNGCDTSIFRPADRRAARESLGIPADGKVVLFVGHLLPGKGVMELLEAFRTLDPEVSDRLVYVGEGRMRDALAAAAGSMGGRVILAGGAPPEGVAQWLAASDLLALPSYSEGCPNVVIEALACGRPVVATPVGATPDLVAEDCGILVRPGDIAALAAALRQALCHAWDHERIATAHRRPWTQVARETFEVCLGVVQKAQERPGSFG